MVPRGVNFKICSRRVMIRIRGRVSGGVLVRVSVSGWIMVMDRSRIRTRIRVRVKVRVVVRVEIRGSGGFGNVSGTSIMEVGVQKSD